MLVGCRSGVVRAVTTRDAAAASPPWRWLHATSASAAPKEWDMSDPEQVSLYKLYRPERITPHKRGIELLKTPGLNKVGVERRWWW